MLLQFNPIAGRGMCLYLFEGRRFESRLGTDFFINEKKNHTSGGKEKHGEKAGMS